MLAVLAAPDPVSMNNQSGWIVRFSLASAEARHCSCSGWLARGQGSGVGRAL